MGTDETLPAGGRSLASLHVEIKVSARHWQRQTLVVNQNSLTQLCAVWAHSLFVLLLHIYSVCVCV
jgi:hypothetical protein